MAVPPAIVWTIGTIGAAIVAKLAIREWKRVNAELDAARAATVAEAERMPPRKLRRDPATGVYRP